MAREVMRRIFGVILGILISCLLTYFVINTFHFIPSFFQRILTFMSIAAVGGFIGGFISRNSKAGFLSGLLAGVIGVPLTTSYLISPMLSLPFGSALTLAYNRNLWIYILFGLIGGTVGAAGAWIESKLIRPQ